MLPQFLRTVKYQLHPVDLYTIRPMACISLTSDQLNARKRWTQKHTRWERDEWNNVLCMDKFLLGVEPNNRWTPIWRDLAHGIILNLRIKVSGIAERSEICAGIFIKSRTDLYIIRNRTRTDLRYKHVRQTYYGPLLCSNQI